MVQILDTIAEIQERHDAVREIEKKLLELHQVQSPLLFTTVPISGFFTLVYFCHSVHFQDELPGLCFVTHLNESDDKTLSAVDVLSR